MLKKTLFINGVEKRVVVDPETTLASVLRNQMFLTGTKVGCGKGECGACTVILDGNIVKSCIVKMKDVEDDSQIITIEGIGTSKKLHPLQLSWIINETAQCGFCTSGFIVSAKALLDQNINPTRDEVRDWFKENNNVCRCTGYEPAVNAVMDAAKLIRGEVSKEELWLKLKEGTSIFDLSLLDSADIAKVTGTYKYDADLGLNLPQGTLHIKLVQAQVPKGNIVSIDTSEAEKMPGVYKVITYKDIPGTNRIILKKGEEKEVPIINDKKIFKEGDPIAMVLAFKPKLAEEAAKCVKVKIEELSEYSEPKAKDEELLPFEPNVGFAYLNERGKLIIQTRNKDLHLSSLAEGIGVPLEKLAIVQNNRESSIGYEFSPIKEGLLGIAALVTKKPVYLEL
ncbi:2Fe-2S iron-sulfur cluster-binding protein [Anaerovorax odorimutans]|uniref:2Fe-2S iron-sulfur cluster-binding protein n=1 Tax=Anaerovorax odorimutans TaxID=109327 RepID=UPI0003FC43A0|nr:2Fe-2S iron-sulfur cluster-binding protein [Anaerovorax odorimutans]